VSPAAGWAMLILSGLVDVAWAYATKRSDGFTDLRWSLLSLLLLVVFLGLLTRALQVLPLGIAYAVWTGIGAVGAMLVGVTLLGEGADAQRLTFAGVTVLGIIGLRLSS
jgi:quaternary ammonium compound-resistance protein SugE